MTFARFAPLVGESFTIAEDVERPHFAEGVMTGAELSSLAKDADRPFSLVFEVSPDVALDQGTYWLAPKDQEPQPIFLVPIGPRRYEAIFN